MLKLHVLWDHEAQEKRPGPASDYDKGHAGSHENPRAVSLGEIYTTMTRHVERGYALEETERGAPEGGVAANHLLATD